MSLDLIESDIFADLAIADRAKLQRVQIVLFDIVEPIHEASVVHTVRHCEHMPDFVNHRPH